ncbi:unnamed protein product [Closterium sp. NIES-54]
MRMLCKPLSQEICRLLGSINVVQGDGALLHLLPHPMPLDMHVLVQPIEHMPPARALLCVAPPARALLCVAPPAHELLCPIRAPLTAVSPCPARAPLAAAPPSPARAPLAAAPPCPARAPLAAAPPCPARALLVATPPCSACAPLAATQPCPARVPTCWLPPYPYLPARRPADRPPALPCLRAALLLTCPTASPAMATLSVLSFNAEGCPIQFDAWLDDLQLYLSSDSRDGVSLFDLTSGASLAPPDTADSANRSLWLTRDAAARLAVRNHLPLAERAHIGKNKTARALYDAVVARYSSPATAALGRHILPYLFPKLSAFATVADLVTHLRTSDTRYRVALPAEFLAKNPPPMYIMLYYIVTRLPDSLSAVGDLLLALDPTDLTVDLLEKHLLAAETSIVVVGASCGTRRTPFFKGGKGKGGHGGGGGSGGGGGGGGGSGGRSGGVGVGGGGDDGGRSGSGGGGNDGGSGSGGRSTRGGWGGAVQRGGSRGGQRRQQQRRSETPSPQQLHEWFSQHGASGGSGSCPYVIRTGDRAGQTCGGAHTKHPFFLCLDNAWRAEFGDEAERLRWAELLRSGVAIFDLEYDAILAAMYALSVSAESDCYLCVPPNLGIEAPALGSSESALPGTAPAEALHTFTLDSGASRCFF